jgi:flagellar export protein FliJ
MNRFQFRLARVQEYRHRQLEAAEEALRRSLAELETLRERKQRLSNEYLAEEAAIANRLTPQPKEREALATYRRHIANEQARLGPRIFECNARVEKQRKEVVEAQRRYRLLEKLYDKGKREWDLAFAKEIDGLAEESFLARWRPV